MCEISLVFVQGCWQVLSPTRKETSYIPQIFMELGGSLLYRQQSTTCPYLSQINPFLCPSNFWLAQLVSFLVGLRTYQQPGRILFLSSQTGKSQNFNVLGREQCCMQYFGIGQGLERDSLVELVRVEVFKVTIHLTEIQSLIQRDGLNFVRLHFLNFTRYENDLHNNQKRRSRSFKYHH